MNKLTVFFDPPYWVGVFEECDNATLRTCRVVFGAEPKDYEILDYVLKHYARLKFSRPVQAEVDAPVGRVNPKRMQREIQRQLECKGISTKAQEAIRLERENNKRERQTITKERKLAEESRRYMLRQEKKKQKKRGH